MTWTYNTRTGQLHHNTTYIATGYSGHGPGKNNPDLERISNLGPIPNGEYNTGHATHHPHLGPCSIPLTAGPNTNTYGRTALWIHGDSTEHPGDASHGCIILPHTAREQIAASDDRSLLVTQTQPNTQNQ